MFEYHTFLHHSQTVRKSSFSQYSFEYHTFLHHSQTGAVGKKLIKCLSTIHFYIILKHKCSIKPCFVGLSTIHFYIILKLIGLLYILIDQFEYHTFLHHSQTTHALSSPFQRFEYHTFLHHSQTSNSKMKCHHSHKIQVLKLLGCYISHPSLSIIYLVTPSMQSLAQVSINKS